MEKKNQVARKIQMIHKAMSMEEGHRGWVQRDLGVIGVLQRLVVLMVWVYERILGMVGMK